MKVHPALRENETPIVACEARMQTAHFNDHEIRQILACLVRLARASDPTFPPANARRPGREHRPPAFGHHHITAGVRQLMYQAFREPGIRSREHTASVLMLLAVRAYHDLESLFDTWATWGSVYLRPMSALFSIHPTPLAVDPRFDLARFSDRIGCTYFTHGSQQGPFYCLVWPPCEPAATVSELQQRAGKRMNDR